LFAEKLFLKISQYQKCSSHFTIKEIFSLFIAYFLFHRKCNNLCRHVLVLQQIWQMSQIKTN